MEEKLKQYFDGMVVKKTEALNLFLSLSIPSFIRDWFLKKYADKNGDVNINFLSEKIKEVLPAKKDFKKLLDKAINDNHARFLGRIRASFDIKSGESTFDLPDFGLVSGSTLIPSHVWDKVKKDLLHSDEEVWGIIQLAYAKQNGKNGQLLLTDFTPFSPYSADLDYFKAQRQHFSLDEWINVLLSAIDYNPYAFKDNDEKLMMLTRLLPFVEKRLNLIELAPKGTGKSYLFSRISKFGWLSSGGVMTRAKMFYDMYKKEEGLVSGYDFVALDEIGTIRFSDVGEMQGALKGYLESGSYTVGNKSGKGDAGVIILGNIPLNHMTTDVNMFESLPAIFKESALIDRFHGFIEGWRIPRITQQMKASGFALNTEYFSLIMHALRNDIGFSDLTTRLVSVSKNSDIRDVTAVKRMTTAFMKLLFPCWQTESDVDIDLFKRYCLNPALHMRTIIKKQLCIIDKEYLNYPVPEFTVN